jgi:hypothetical protein
VKRSANDFASGDEELARMEAQALKDALDVVRVLITEILLFERMETIRFAFALAPAASRTSRVGIETASQT